MTNLQCSIWNLVSKQFPVITTMTARERAHFLYTLEDKEDAELNLLVEKFILGDLYTEDFDYDRHPQLLNTLNHAMCFLYGIEDSTSSSFFQLNEYMDKNESTSTWDTVYDYSLDNHNFQEKCRSEDNPNYTPKAHGCSLAEWCRIAYDYHFHYAHIMSVSSYLTFELENIMRETVDKLYPHEFVSGEHDGERTDDGMIRWDKVIAAQGKELELDKLNKACWEYTAKRCQEIEQYYQNKDDGLIITFNLKDSYCNNPELDKYFIFFDHKGMKNIRFDHFMSDIEDHAMKDDLFLKRILNVESRNFSDFILKEYERIEEESKQTN